MEEQREGSHKRKSILKIVVITFVLILLISATAIAIYFYMQYQKSQNLLQNSTLSANQQAQQLVIAVGKLIELPRDEDPSIATVSDVSKLTNQPFFAHAKNGDKVLIYAKNKKAILYDPVTNKIVEVAPVNINTTPQPTQAMPTIISPTSTIAPLPSKIMNSVNK